MMLCTGDFPIVVGGEGDRPRRPTTNRTNARASEKTQAGPATPRSLGQTDRGRPPPTIGLPLVMAAWWIAFGSAILQQWACG